MYTKALKFGRQHYSMPKTIEGLFKLQVITKPKTFPFSCAKLATASINKLFYLPHPLLAQT